jgi:hypothetical protein
VAEAKVASRFAVDVRKFAVKTAKKAVIVPRVIAVDVFGRVILKTPVGNPDLWKRPESAPPGYTGGRLRGNWQASVGAPAEGELGIRSAVEAEGEVFAAAAAWGGEGSIFLTNNLPYAEEIERGHSKQAPQGMVRVTVTEYPGIVERRAREARSR